MHVPLLGLAELVVAAAAFTLTTAIAWRVSRGGGSAAVTILSESNKVLEQKVHDQQRRIDQLGAEVRDLRVENTALAARTDYQAVINEHERRAEERHKATLAVLELIAARLGPEPTT